MTLLSLHQLIELVRIGVGNHVGSHPHKPDLIKELVDRGSHAHHGDIARVDDGSHTSILISRGGRHDEKRLDTIFNKAFHNTVTRRAQTSGDMGRELPTEHQNSHGLFLLPEF